jgi:hypothetical protein
MYRDNRHPKGASACIVQSGEDVVTAVEDAGMMSDAYTHQQDALIPYNVQRAADYFMKAIRAQQELIKCRLNL